MRIVIPLFYLLAILITDRSLAGTPIEMVADDWCPFTCQSRSDKPGLITEVAKQAFAAKGLVSRYRLTGWRRALRNVEVGRMDVLLGADQSMSEVLFLDDRFTVKDETIFLAKKSTNIVFDAKPDLTPYSIGTIADYSYTDSEVWAQAIEKHPRQLKLSSSAGERRLIELLLMDRFDIALVNRDVAARVLSELGAFDLVEIYRPGMESSLFLGFTKNPAGLKLRDQFQAGFNMILESGELKQIYHRYQIDYPF